MNAYQYRALNADGKTVAGRIEASNEADLELRLAHMGLELIRFRSAARSPFARVGGRFGRRELITFCFHLEQLTRAGVPIVAGLADLRDSLANARFRAVLSSLTEDIEGGRTLSEALERFPQQFDRVFVSLVRAGEQSGMLPEVLRRLGESLKWQDELAAQTKKIILYPSFVAVVVLGVFFFLMTYLVPQLAGFMQSMNQELPMHTRALIWTSDVLIHYWYAVLALPAIAVFSVRYLARVNETVRYRLDSAKLTVPPVGPILRNLLLARFASNFALMYRAGITVLDCIRTSEDLVNNAVIGTALRRVHDQISAGTTMTAAFESAGLFPPLVVRMLHVGESTGALEQALENVAYFYTRDGKESVERIQGLVEPALTVVLGLLLGWMMLSVLGPIYDILGHLQT